VTNAIHSFEQYHCIVIRQVLSDLRELGGRPGRQNFVNFGSNTLTNSLCLNLTTFSFIASFPLSILSA
jgi:hypothetical protein